jgi:hypothetical protein
VRRAAAGFGHRPVGFGVAAAVGQGCRGNDRALDTRQHHLGEGPRRVDPVPVETKVKLPPLESLDRQPVDHLGRALVAQRRQHIAPSRQLVLAAALKAAAGRLDASPPVAVQRVCFGIEALGQGLGQSGHRLSQALQRGGQHLRRREQARHRRPGVGLQAVGSLRARGPGIDLLAHVQQEALRRAMGRAARQALLPALTGQRARRAQHRLQRLAALRVVGHEVLDAPLEAAHSPGAAPVGLGAEQPAP